MTQLPAIEIKFEYADGDPDIYELIEKGFRKDVSIVVGGKETKVNFYTAERLIHELKIWMETKNWNFIVQANLVIQDELDNESIRQKLRRLVAAGVFV